MELAWENRDITFRIKLCHQNLLAIFVRILSKNASQQNVFRHQVNGKYHKTSINPPRDLFISSPLEEWTVLIEMGAYSNLEKTMVSVLHKELEYKVENLKSKKVGGQAPKDQKQIRTSSW